ncbi:GATOR complex protein WDR24 [Eurytemora carolleeae]|uniref:GATOR complex protein WDR24 n=1 Tax=Eurytemora carolleeae TaxID=1294199 RepID=UPI000C756F33|nr:GATOR complex protein WDR24 [Eurytemora carolleeae]|eukprot:XP_023322719.1 GATOR complex protein WDR24-like [Eurytemora affinis]
MVRTMHVLQESPANALDLSKDFSHVVVAGRNMMKIYSIEEEEFVEKINLGGGKKGNYNLNCNDVVWSPIDDQLIATGATNGAVVLWNLGITGKSKQEKVFEDHKRTINKVNFHPTEAHNLITGSQDGTLRLFDLRTDHSQPTLVFQSHAESVRDVQFNPHQYWQFAAVSENGQIQLWDMRRTDRCEKHWPAHSSLVFACDWHPEQRNWLATGGRDKTIKVWDTSKGGPRHEPEHTIYTIGSVGRVKWRPQRKDYLSSSSLVVDSAIHVWDIKRPFVPFASFDNHKDVTTDIAWRGDPHIMISTSKDGTLFHHVFTDAARPGDKANPVGLSMNSRGEITHASRHMVRADNAIIPLLGNKMQRKNIPLTELFRMCKSKLCLYSASKGLLSEEDTIRGIAEGYRVVDGTLSELCDINAKVAMKMGREQVSLTWTILKTIYACAKSEVCPISGDLGAGQDEEARGRVSRLRSQSGKQSNRQQSRNVSGNSSESESESENENCRTLTDIASGYTIATITGDFFGDAELAGMGVEHLVSLEGGAGGAGGEAQDNSRDWILPSEAFEQRQEILEGGREEDLVVGVEGEGDLALQTVTVEDKTSAVVVWGIHAGDTRTTWNHLPDISDTLVWFAENGDVQTAVSMYLVLTGGTRGNEGGCQVKGLVAETTLEHWFFSYIELLQRLQLFTKANEILRLCPLSSVNTMNHESTTVNSCCGSCGRNLVRKSGTWWCERCRVSPATCSVCHAVVRGLIVWCQGCGHGGHVHHVQEWIKKRPGCPAGCGHHCQF